MQSKVSLVPLTTKVQQITTCCTARVMACDVVGATQRKLHMVHTQGTDNPRSPWPPTFLPILATDPSHRWTSPSPTSTLHLCMSALQQSSLPHDCLPGRHTAGLSWLWLGVLSLIVLAT
ncbi:hypothetical protein E2C01_065691 [Portunus trituberculatus]|uniref:Uncharacterized protein n=1 Tax=Portunus trituberculatus TaxID=210409 RepID=A0A5B7HSG4_PORTR|nr:hypothetical protein [Portunus trituberculatus]